MIVEDDAGLARGIEATLTASGFAVDRFSRGEDAIDMAGTEPYSVIVLDLGLPDMDGLDVVQQLRARRVQTPIIILTARDEMEDRIRGLDRGADDYLPKPFDPRELEARMRALIRRSHGSPDPVLKCGALTFDPASRTAFLDEEAIDLRRRELAVLEALMRRQGRVVAKESLCAEIFNFNDAVAPNAVEVYVGRLRRKLMPDGPAIRTVRGLGYMMHIG